jgi:hypothetical protein
VACHRDLLDALEEHGYEWSEGGGHAGRAEAEREFARLLAGYEAHHGASAEVDDRLRQLESALLAWMALAPLDQRVYRRFRLEQELAAGNHSPAEPYDANMVAELIPLLLGHAPAAARTPSGAALVAELLRDDRAVAFLRMNSFEGESYFDREAFRMLSDGVALAGSVLQLAREGVAEGLPERLAELRRLEEESGYRLARLRRSLALSSPGAPATPAGGRSDG